MVYCVNFYLPANIVPGNIMVQIFMYVSDKYLFETLQSSTVIHFFYYFRESAKMKERAIRYLL